LGYIAHSVG